MRGVHWYHGRVTIHGLFQGMLLCGLRHVSDVNVDQDKSHPESAFRDLRAFRSRTRACYSGTSHQFDSELSGPGALPNYVFSVVIPTCIRADFLALVPLSRPSLSLFVSDKTQIPRRRTTGSASGGANAGSKGGVERGGVRRRRRIALVPGARSLFPWPGC